MELTMSMFATQADYWKARAEIAELALADAKHAMRAYARENPRHEYQGVTQDPNGVHAWLARNDQPNVAGNRLDPVLRGKSG